MKIENLQLRALPPTPDADSTPFWEALADGRLQLTRCGSCGTASFPPIPSCPRCAADTVVPVEASGSGRVYSWATIHIALDPTFADDVPYTIVAVDLEDGPRMLGRLLDRDGPPAAGLAVRLVPYRVDGNVLPGFRAD
jgi:uncharacterized protein